MLSTTYNAFLVFHTRSLQLVIFGYINQSLSMPHLGTLNATAFGPACYGRVNPNPSEDCLTLNIWRPSDASAANGNTLLPVLVWFYGGGLAGGYTVCCRQEYGYKQFLKDATQADNRFEGTNLVRTSTEINKPVILVSVVCFTSQLKSRLP